MDDREFDIINHNEIVILSPGATMTVRRRIANLRREIRLIEDSLDRGTEYKVLRRVEVIDSVERCADSVASIRKIVDAS